MPTGTQEEIDAKKTAETAMNLIKKELQQAQVEADKFKKANEAFKTQQADKDAAVAAEKEAAKQAIIDAYTAAEAELEKMDVAVAEAWAAFDDATSKFPEGTPEFINF